MKKKRCNIMTWRKNETTWLADRANDRKVFRLINRKRLKGMSIDKAITRLINDSRTKVLMTGKTPASWKRKYLLVTIGKRKNNRF